MAIGVCEEIKIKKEKKDRAQKDYEQKILAAKDEYKKIEVVHDYFKFG